MKVSREQALAYRVTALGLAERSTARPADLPVLDLGIQEYTPGSERVALAARTGAELSDDRLVTVWAARGAPHQHRRRDLGWLVQALWPLSDADAAARTKSAQVPAAQRLGIEAIRVTARAFREVVTGPMPRGEVSAEVSRRIPAELTYDCRACAARHVAGTVWQPAGLPGGVLVAARGRDALLAPIAGAPPLPGRNAGIGELITAYLRLLGPAGPAEVARYLGTTATEIKRVWPAGLDEVTVAGRRAWLPAGGAATLGAVERPRGVRFLPPMDPLLQARDRELLIPERDRQKEVWRVLGNPGVLLVDGEPAGVWRAKTAGRKRVDLTVTAFDAMPATTRKAVEEEAGVVARAREVGAATVAWS
ncbi:DNA glycosylase AlkZ-like family protein [Symbioplanes lichenis]|uniref:DNA glycosylase AlkZ-like family protein n=1 Tax=Symbioplanes lichenis TaxID=1629072 RepID=UPI0027396AB6|nr:crosslink repair DNA glycosylase YcaQ family protein [Actinoplanes lichenis]